MKLEFLGRFSKKNSQISSVIIIHPVAAELFHADEWIGRQAGRQTDRQTDRQIDRQTDRRDETNSCFSEFCECV